MANKKCNRFMILLKKVSVHFRAKRNHLRHPNLNACIFLFAVVPSTMRSIIPGANRFDDLSVTSITNQTSVGFRLEFDPRGCNHDYAMIKPYNAEVSVRSDRQRKNSLPTQPSYAALLSSPHKGILNGQRYYVCRPPPLLF